MCLREREREREREERERERERDNKKGMQMRTTLIEHHTFSTRCSSRRRRPCRSLRQGDSFVDVRGHSRHACVSIRVLTQGRSTEQIQNEDGVQNHCARMVMTISLEHHEKYGFERVTKEENRDGRVCVAVCQSGSSRYKRV